jgi:hypothetical protein
MNIRREQVDRVVEAVRRRPVRLRLRADDEAVDPEDPVERASDDQVDHGGAEPIPGGEESENADRQMQAVVEIAQLPDSEPHPVRVVPGHLHLVVVVHDLGDEAHDPERDEARPDEHGKHLRSQTPG